MIGMQHEIFRTTTSIEPAAERILRCLPQWFGVEESLQDYVRDTSLYPTFVAAKNDTVNAFITVKQHFPASAEIHCIAVEASLRGRRLGKALVHCAREWAAGQGVLFLLVKTLAQSHPSPEYAQTRAFYVDMGFVPLEILPELWSPHNPCLQMIQYLPQPQRPTAPAV